MTFDLRGMDEHCPTRDRSAEVVSYTGERNLSERNCSTGVAVTAGERQCVRFAPEFKKRCENTGITLVAVLAVGLYSFAAGLGVRSKP